MFVIRVHMSLNGSHDKILTFYSHLNYVDLTQNRGKESTCSAALKICKCKLQINPASNILESYLNLFYYNVKHNIYVESNIKSSEK